MYGFKDRPFDYFKKPILQVRANGSDPIFPKRHNSAHLQQHHIIFCTEDVLQNIVEV